MALTIRAAQRLLASHDITSTSLVQRAFEALDRHSGLNAIAASDRLRAQREAESADADARPQAALAGIPMTVKDLYQVDGFPTRGGTRAPLPDLGPTQAVAVSRLRAAGAIVIAKTNMHEIAAGISGENPWTGDVKNPHDPARQAGGSSGGSAVAVATGIGLAALGSDTAGSIRIPAAFCGVTGFKPTHGLIPLDGALPLSWSCDHAGPLTRDVTDAHLLTEIMAARRLPLRPAALHAPTRVGVPWRMLDGWLDDAVAASFHALLARLAPTTSIHTVALPEIEHALAKYGPIRGAESFRVHRAALASNPEGFSDITRARLIEGQQVSAAAYLDALNYRARLRETIETALRAVDVLLLPTIPTRAPIRGSAQVELQRGPTDHREAFLRLTLPFSMTGLPALSIPMAGANNANTLPLGVQLVGRAGADARVLEAGLWLEKLLGTAA